MKKKRRKKRCGLLVFFLVLFFGGGVAFYIYGKTITTTTATNIVKVGKVDVELHMETHDAKTISSGSIISNVVTVENIGQYPAYVRMYIKKHWEITESGAKLTQAQISSKYSALSEKAIDINLATGWTKGAENASYPGYDCYYYNEVVSTEKKGTDAIHFSDFYQLRVEETENDGGITNELLIEFTKNGAKVDGYYSVIVEAIQADRNIPITSNGVITGWDEEPSDKVDLPSLDEGIKNEKPSGEVDFKSENAVITNASEFIKIDHLLPGETEARKITVGNSSNLTLPIYVYAESSEGFADYSHMQKEWLRQLQLVIMKEDGKVLYNNSLYKPNSDELMLSKYNPVLIGNFTPGAKENLYVFVSCPATWTQGDVDVVVNWLFASQKAVPTKEPSSGGGAAIIITKIPTDTEKPAMETEIPVVTDVPEETVLVITDVPKETETVRESNPPLVTGEPIRPMETGVIITDSPIYEVEDTIAPATVSPTENVHIAEIPKTEQPDATKSSVTVTPKGTKKPTKKPKVTESPVPETDLNEETSSDNVIGRTSTPKESSEVGAVYPTKTGDATPIVIWLAVFMVSFVGMTSAIIAYRKCR